MAWLLNCDTTLVIQPIGLVLGPIRACQVLPGRFHVYHLVAVWYCIPTAVRGKSVFVAFGNDKIQFKLL